MCQAQGQPDSAKNSMQEWGGESMGMPQREWKKQASNFFLKNFVFCFILIYDTKIKHSLVWGTSNSYSNTSVDWERFQVEKNKTLNIPGCIKVEAQSAQAPQQKVWMKIKFTIIKTKVHPTWALFRL